MISNEYSIYLTDLFKEELQEMLHYIKYKLKEPLIANVLYRKITKAINSLKTMPERNAKIYNSKYNLENIHKLFIKKYVIIYKVDIENGNIFILHIFHCNQNYLNLI